MRRFVAIILIVCAFACPFVVDVGTAYAQTPTRFTDDYEPNSDWFEPQNWTEGVPNIDKHAIINEGLLCVIPSDTEAFAKSLIIEPGAELNLRHLEIPPWEPKGSTLTFSENMTVEAGGKFAMDKKCKLFVTDGQITLKNGIGTLFIIEKSYGEQNGGLAVAETIVIETNAEFRMRQWGVLALGKVDTSLTSTVDGLLRQAIELLRRRPSRGPVPRRRAAAALSEANVPSWNDTM